MAVSIVQSDTTGWVTGSSATFALGSPVSVGSLIVLLFLCDGTVGPTIAQVLLDGISAGPAVQTSTEGSAELRVEAHIWNATVAVSDVRVSLSSGGTPWLLSVFEVGDEAHILPYVLTDSTGNGPTVNPSTPAWSAADDGLVVGLLMATQTVAITEPAGWTSLSVSSVNGRAAQIASRPTTPGAQVAESFTATVTAGNSWVSAVLPFYDVALRLRPAGAFASNGGGNLLVPGPVEPPNPVVPFIAETNPLPPLPSDIEVPLPPWIPKPGPYRDDD